VRAATMRPLIEDLCANKANQRRAAFRKAKSKDVIDLPAADTYCAAIAGGTTSFIAITPSNSVSCAEYCTYATACGAGLRPIPRMHWPLNDTSIAASAMTAAA
jgi:hypothetical protein